jgi:trehalose-6-phosphatase
MVKSLPASSIKLVSSRLPDAMPLGIVALGDDVADEYEFDAVDATEAAMFYPAIRRSAK